MNKNIHKSTIRIRFPNNNAAEIAKATLLVDEELQPEKIEKKFSVEENLLIVYANII